MTIGELELLREWVRAEIDSAIASREESEDGSTGNNYSEKRLADGVFSKLCLAIEARGKT